MKTKFAFSIGLLGLLWCMLGSAARADSIYTYAGNPFTLCGGEGATTYTCNGTTPVLSITFDVANPLAANLNLKNIANKLTSLTITDGTGLDITLANATSGLFEFSTDASGHITDWAIEASTTVSMANPISYDILSENSGGGANKDSSQTSVETFNKKGNGIVTTVGVGENDGSAVISTTFPSDPGTWTTPSFVPEPSSLLLLASGLLLGMLHYGRRHGSPAGQEEME